MQKSKLHSTLKVVLSIITSLAMLVPSALFIVPQKAHALATAPGNTACDFFTQDSDYVVGNPPPASVWTPSFGNWIIATDTAEDVLHQDDIAASNPNDAINLLVATGELEDFVFSTDIKPLTGNNDVGIVFRANDHDNLYLFRVDGTGGTAGLFKRVAGTYSLLAPEVPYALTTGAEYEFHVAMIGTNIRSYINNALVLTASDSTFTSGFAGLRTHSSTAYFDNTCVGVGPFTWDVDDNGVECPDPDFTLIQEAIDFAGAGDTIHVCAGTYQEQLTITKQLKISGDGPTSIAKLPPGRPLDPAKTVSIATLDDTQADPLMWVENADNVTLEKLFFDGNDDLSGMAMTVGIIFKNAKGAVQDSTFGNFNAPSWFGIETGMGIWVEGASSDALIKNNIMNEILNRSISVQQGHANILDNKLIGLDAASINPQKGIELWNGTGGLILNNTVNDFNDPSPAISYGITIVNGANGITLSGNKLAGNEISVFIDPTNNGKLISSNITGSKTADIMIQNSSGWMISQNNLTGSLGRSLVLENVSNSQFNINTVSTTAQEGIVLAAIAGGASNNNTFVQNTVSAAGGDSILLSMDGSAGNSMTNNSFTSNTVKDGQGNGFSFEAVGSNRFTNTSLKANKATSNQLSGISLGRSNGAKIEVNTVTGNKQHGIQLKTLSNGTTVSKNTITGNKRHGIALQGNSDNNKFTLNTVKTNGNGVTFFDVFWDQNAGATGNSATLNFFTTKKPAFFWN